MATGKYLRTSPSIIRLRKHPTLFTAPVTLLKADDAIILLEELLPAQTHSYLLGLKLGLPVHVVDSIFATHLQPRDRLLHIMIAFLNQGEPTWEAVVQALQSPAVGLLQLAKKLEAVHISGPTSQNHIPTSTTTCGMLVFFPGSKTFFVLATTLCAHSKNPPQELPMWLGCQVPMMLL